MPPRGKTVTESKKPPCERRQSFREICPCGDPCGVTGGSAGLAGFGGLPLRVSNPNPSRRRSGREEQKTDDELRLTVLGSREKGGVPRKTEKLASPSIYPRIIHTDFLR